MKGSLNVSKLECSVREIFQKLSEADRILRAVRLYLYFQFLKHAFHKKEIRYY